MANKTYQETILETDGLVAYYPLHADLVDVKSGGSLHYDHTNPPFFTTTDVGDGLQSSATGFCNAVAEKDFGRTPIYFDKSITPATVKSMEFWYKPMINDPFSYYADILGNDHEHTNRYLLVTAKDQHYQNYMGTSFAGRLSDDLTVESLFNTVGGNHIVWQVEGGSTVLYVNGKVKFTYPSDILSSRVTLGLLTDSNGSVSDFALYSEPLNASTIDSHLNHVAHYSGEIDFVPMSEVPEKTVYPTGALVSTSVGTGLLNSNGSTVYIKTRFNISKGEVKHLISDDLSFKSKLEFALDGTVTLTEGNLVTTGNTGLDIIGITHQNGQLSLLGDDLVVILTSTLFNYNYAFPSVPILDGETVDSVANPIFNVGAVELLWHLGFTYGSPMWSNKETKEQANPQPEQLATLDANAPIATTVVKNNPFYNDVVLDQQGNQRKFGYIASTTQVSGAPVGNKRVLLFADDTAMLIDETVSDAQGNYRFDSLLLNKKYMITAQYGNADENTQPDYSATSVDWQSPTPYIEEV